jgi:RHS repeat-associated protein
LISNTYDEVGNLKTETNARGKVTTYWYDDGDRNTQADHPDSTHEYWSYRDDGRVYQHRDGRGRVTTYRYDADDRLAGSGSYVAINYPNDTDVQIVRDRDGLVTSFTDGTGASSLVYYPSAWLKTFTNGAGKTLTYEYNGVGAVSKLTAPDTSKWFSYGYTNRNQLGSVVDQDSLTLSSFSYDKRADGTVRYPLYEGIGSVRRLMDGAATVTDSYTFDAFGYQPSSTGTTPNPYRYGAEWGYITDPSGLLQLGARYYWPEVGRFVSQDPIRDDASLYVYADGNPVASSDATGLRSMSARCRHLHKLVEGQEGTASGPRLCRGLNQLLVRLAHECGDHDLDTAYREGRCKKEAFGRCMEDCMRPFIPPEGGPMMAGEAMQGAADTIAGVDSGSNPVKDRFAHSDESGHAFRRKPAGHSD